MGDGYMPNGDKESPHHNTIGISPDHFIELYIKETPKKPKAKKVPRINKEDYFKLTGDEKKRLCNTGEIKRCTITLDPENEGKHHCIKIGGSSNPIKGEEPAK